MDKKLTYLIHKLHQIIIKWLLRGNDCWLVMSEAGS